MNCVVVVEILIQIQLVIVIRKFICTFFNVFRLSYRTTGHCLRCNRNTYGVYCEKCLPGHWGDALLDIKCHGKMISSSSLYNLNSYKFDLTYSL